MAQWVKRSSFKQELSMTLGTMQQKPDEVAYTYNPNFGEVETN